jgi:hypothetical protein
MAAEDGRIRLATGIGHVGDQGRAARERQPIPSNGFDMLVPEVGERDVVAGECQMTTNVSADGSCAEHYDP